MLNPRSPLWVPPQDRLTVRDAKQLAVEIERTGLRAAPFVLGNGYATVEVWHPDTNEKRTIRSRRDWGRLEENDAGPDGSQPPQ